MCGAYIGMDEFRSKLAVFAEKFGGDNDIEGREVERSNWSPLF